MSAIVELLFDRDPDFEAVYFGEAGQVGVFTLLRRSDGAEVGQLRTGWNFLRVIRFDLPHTVPSPKPFFSGWEEDGEEPDESFVPAWDTWEGFLGGLKEHPVEVSNV